MKSTVCLHLQETTKKKNTKKNINIKQELSGDEGDLDQDSFDDEIEVKKHLKVGGDNSRMRDICLHFWISCLFTLYIFYLLRSTKPERIWWKVVFKQPKNWDM